MMTWAQSRLQPNRLTADVHRLRASLQSRTIRISLVADAARRAAREPIYVFPPKESPDLNGELWSAVAHSCNWQMWS
jgi:hypothetical protein